MKKLINILFLGFLVLMVLVTTQISQAATDNKWQNSVPSIYSNEQYNNTNLPIEYYANIPCSAYKNQILNGQTKNYCAVNTGSYQISDTAEVIVAGSSVSHYLVNPANTNSRLIPLNNSSNIVQINNNGKQVNIINDAYSNLNIRPIGQVKNVEITSTSQQDVLDPYNNNEKLLSNDATNVSANGEWFVGMNGRGIYKLNIATKQLQYIRKGEYNLNGLTANLKLSVSNSGRYVAVYVGKANTFEILDTNNCQNIQASNGTDAICAYNRLDTFINNGVSNIYQSVPYRNVQFINEDVLSFYAFTDWVDNTNYKVKKVLIAASDNVDPASKYNYIAFGDSYASGEGAFSYKDGTDEKLNKCHLSALSYPYLIAKDGITGKTESVACSGAKIKDVINIENVKYTDNSPQSSIYSDTKYKDFVLQSFTPGNIRQVDFASTYKPQNVTISIGGNDIGFSKIVTKCVTDTSECYNTKQDRQELINTIDNNYNNLVKTYSTIKTESAAKANIYVIGYPQVAKADGNCAQNVKLTNNEIIFSNQLVSYLNRVIKMAAGQAGVAYVDVEHAFDGYRLCEAPSQSLAINGLTAGNDGPLPGLLNELFNGPLGKESYHPNILGHRLYAQAISKTTNNFTLTMPTPILNNPVGDSAEKSALLDAVPTGYDFSGTNYYNDTIAPNYTTKNSQVNITLDKNAYNLKPNQNISVVAYSEPTNLGTISTLSDGTISSTINIPDTLSPGYHTLKITGQTVFDTTITIQKLIYVAASELDIDGDGTPNEKEVCLLGEPSGIDQDKDGIDDACDGTILEAPLPPPPSVDPPNPTTDTNTNPPADNTNQTPPPPVMDNQPKTPLKIVQNKIENIVKSVKANQKNQKPILIKIITFVINIFMSFRL